MTWHDAEAACEADGPGAHLVIIDDAAEVDAVMAVLTFDVNDFWVGGSDLTTEDTFLAVTGASWTWDVWLPDQPDASGDCLSMVRTGELDDTSCANDDDYVCEYDGVPASPAAGGQ